MADSRKTQWKCFEWLSYVDRSRIYDFYWDIEVSCHETQNLADNGWFLEILGKMAESKRRWSHRDIEMVLA